MKGFSEQFQPNQMRYHEKLVSKELNESLKSKWLEGNQLGAKDNSNVIRASL
jgi:hypothetical protein